MSSIKKICVTAIMIALCCILPTMFHMAGLGTAFSPMHIPVLLCGLICGGWYGLFCGVAGPILSSLLTGMPGASMLLSMVPELIAYGLITGLAMRLIRTGKLTADLYISLIIAMLAGRVVGGIAKALVFMGSGEAFTLSVWVSSYFVTALPGIICHLIVVPVLVMALYRAKLIPARYSRAK
ncbi:MAG: ECF transporter S component [Clostridia bacterium]|nr:ECF transporter S component [Clostridia bacterium]